MSRITQFMPRKIPQIRAANPKHITHKATIHAVLLLININTNPKIEHKDARPVQAGPI